ncbi:metal-dependent hydrolase [Sphingomonas turrisvirgatae]|uniref:Metal-dependent hydrolase n=2 Tax=Sphingomonas turrisvirgatae TaxID=1888892 RepID=A0A1E3LTE0_9SPHN|nr:metal-dependent hydrolase [Sphingomonas turrisvirgatae]
MKLSVDNATGRVRLTLPSRASARDGLRWAEGQQAWIAQALTRRPDAVPFEPGATILYLGETVALGWDSGFPRTPLLDDGQLIAGGPREGYERRIERWLRARALDVMRAETAEYAARAGVTVAKVAIGDAKGRWGSCASSGVIRYSWRLILAPPDVRRATVAHEVAHRVHMNHSPAFHAVVRDLYGREPTRERAWLRANALRLHSFGRTS